jgi:hypothetical protein
MGIEMDRRARAQREVRATSAVVSAAMNSYADLHGRAVRRVDKEVHLHSMPVRTEKEKQGKHLQRWR